MSISTQRREKTVTVAVAGEVDLAAGAAAEAAIMSALTEPDVDTVVVDLTTVTFLDSSGISVLLAGRRAADERGVTYRIAGAGGIVRKVLDLTGVWPLLSGEAG